MDVKSDPKYCPLYYKGMYVEKKDSVTLSQAHCCSSRLGGEIPAADFYNYPEFVSNRQRWPMERLPDCERCWFQEDNNLHSFRKGWINWLDQQGPGIDPTTPELLKLDYNVGPICNAKCVHCSSIYSSQWAAEDAKFADHEGFDWDGIEAAFEKNLKQGRIVDSGSPDALLARYGREDMEEVFLDIARDRAAVPA